MDVYKNCEVEVCEITTNDLNTPLNYRITTRQIVVLTEYPFHKNQSSSRRPPPGYSQSCLSCTLVLLLPGCTSQRFIWYYSK